MFEKIKKILGFTTKRRVNDIIKKLKTHRLFIEKRTEEARKK